LGSSAEIAESEADVGDAKEDGAAMHATLAHRHPAATALRIAKRSFTLSFLAI